MTKMLPKRELNFDVCYLLLYGFIAVNGLKVLVQNKVDFNNTKNVIVASAMLVLGLGGAAISIVSGDLSLTISGMSLAAIVGILLNVFLKGEQKEVLIALINADFEFGLAYSINYISKNGNTRNTTDYFEGIITNLERRYRETTSDYTKMEIERYMVVSACSTCHGKRLKKEALAVKIDGKNISDLTDMSISDIYTFVDGLTFGTTHSLIAKPIIKEIKARVLHM